MFRCCFLAAVDLLFSVGALTAQTPNAAPAPATTEATLQETMEDPQVGDHWTYEVRDDITGDLKSTFTTTVTDVSTTDISIRDTIVGNSNFGYASYDRSWNRISNDTWRFTPNDGMGIRSPLAVGKTWSVKASDLLSTKGLTCKRSVTSKVVAKESVTTRAGTFDTYKIEASVELRNTNDPTKKFLDMRQTWYAPAIDHWVKLSSVMRSDGRVRSKTSTELVEYGRR
jgi:hypothetical protein